MPAELLAEVDAEAQRLGSTRSGVLRSFAEAALSRRRADRAGAMRQLLQDAAGRGGGAADLVKSTRPAP